MQLIVIIGTNVLTKLFANLRIHSGAYSSLLKLLLLLFILIQQKTKGKKETSYLIVFWFNYLRHDYDHLPNQIYWNVTNVPSFCFSSISSNSKCDCIRSMFTLNVWSHWITQIFLFLFFSLSLSVRLFLCWSFGHFPHFFISHLICPILSITLSISFHIFSKNPNCMYLTIFHITHYHHPHYHYHYHYQSHLNSMQIDTQIGHHSIKKQKNNIDIYQSTYIQTRPSVPRRPTLKRRLNRVHCNIRRQLPSWVKRLAILGNSSNHYRRYCNSSNRHNRIIIIIMHRCIRIIIPIHRVKSIRVNPVVSRRHISLIRIHRQHPAYISILKPILKAHRRMPMVFRRPMPLQPVFSILRQMLLLPLPPNLRRVPVL